MKMRLQAPLALLSTTALAVALTASAHAQPEPRMTFFVTSAVAAAPDTDLGGLTGADELCQRLAAAVNAGDLQWHAYLSTSAVAARDRIGAGPWHNSAGVLIANDVADLHDGSNGITGQTARNERGQAISGAIIVYTGSLADGTVSSEYNCVNWTNGFYITEGVVGRPGSGSWNAAQTASCDSAFVMEDNGALPRLYCFAVGPMPATTEP